MSAGIRSVHGHDTDVSGPSIGEAGAELLALLQTALDGVGTHGTETVVGIAGVRLGALLALGHLGQVAAALDGVDEDEARREHGVRGPGSEHLNHSATGKRVILRVDIEVGNLADTVACGVVGDGCDVVDTETRSVGGLVDEAVLDVLVVVNALVGG